MKRSSLILGLAALAVLLLHLSRNWSQLTDPVLYGEEGKIFFLQAYEFGVHSLAMTYAGYLHSFPRLYALAFSGFPLTDLPFYYHLAGPLAHLLLLYAVLRWSTTLPLWTKLTALFATVLIPHGGEVYLNLPNTINILGPIPWLLLLAPPRPGLWRFVDAGLLLLAALSGPYILLALPVMLWTLFRDRRATPLLISAFLGLAIQLYGLKLGVRDQIQEPLSFTTLMTAFSALLTPSLFGWLPLRLSLDQSLAVLAIFLGLCGWRLRQNPLPLSSRALALLASGLLVWGAGLFMGLGSPASVHPLGWGQRYFWVPYVLLALALLDWSYVRPRWTAFIFALIFSSGVVNWSLRVPTHEVRAEYKLDHETGLVEVRVFPDSWNFSFRPRPEDVSLYQR